MIVSRFIVYTDDINIFNQVGDRLIDWDSV